MLVPGILHEEQLCSLRNKRNARFSYFNLAAARLHRLKTAVFQQRLVHAVSAPLSRRTKPRVSSFSWQKRLRFVYKRD